MDGNTTWLESAYIRSDTRRGVERLLGHRKRADIAIPLAEVEAIEQERVDATKTLLLAAGVVGLLALIASSFASAAVLY